MNQHEEIIEFIRTTFGSKNEFIPLHAPYFGGNEKAYVTDTIDSTFVSSVGAYVNTFEKMMCDITGAAHAIAIVNGTAALHLALLLIGVKPGDEVITQPLTFVATANAIAHAGGKPVFVDVDKRTLSMSPTSLEVFLANNCIRNKAGECINKATKQVIRACLPMHTFGFPCEIDTIMRICKDWGISVVEDAAESLGSYYQGQHTGTFGKIGTFSFNGNKTVTCGGGGAIVTNDPQLGKLAKHISTTAKIPHAWEFDHDMTAYNYRMPNLNAALACAQLEQLPTFIRAKRNLAKQYATFFATQPGIRFFTENPRTQANYWLNTIIFSSPDKKDAFLQHSNNAQVMTRPVWKLMTDLPMYQLCQRTDLPDAEWLVDRIVNIPSSYIKGYEEN